MKGFLNMFAAVIIFLLVIVISAGLLSGKTAPSNAPEKIGCAGDNSECDYADTSGKLCIPIDDPNTKDKIEYTCGCVAESDCPSGKKCVKESESYGSCK